MDSNYYDLIILGSGPAGCTAAIYAAQAGLNFALAVGNQRGGQLTRTATVSNWPGEVKGIAGAVLMEKLWQQVANLNVPIIYDMIVRAEIASHPFRIYDAKNNAYDARVLIVATGTTPRLLGLAQEQEYLGRGVSICAICDGFFYRNCDVIVVGGGNTMAEEALYLAEIAATVTVIHRGNELRADAALLEQLRRRRNVTFMLNSTLKELLVDDNGVVGVKVQDVASGLTREFSVRGVFIAIGADPNSQVFNAKLAMVDNYIKIGYSLASQTSIAGIFAAGDVVWQNYRQAIVAAGSGCIAALDASHFLGSILD